MNGLYVTGGHQRTRIFKKIQDEWNLYERALILRVNLEKGTSETTVEYRSPPEVCANSETPSFLFKAGSLREDLLYVCTSTEVLVFKVPEFRRVGYVSLRCFNDLHHVSPTAEGNLLVINTGLDMVVEISMEGKRLREWNVLGEDPWCRFSREIDYRKIETTKPHKSHPNYGFQLGNDIWVTRAMQRDCISLTEKNHRILIGGQIVHDGHAYGDKIYFTQVDGHLIIVDQKTRQVVKTIDLNTIDNEEGAVLGWCRGMLILDERMVWVAFTRVRQTKFRENINWVKNVVGVTEKPAHLALYDLQAKKCLKEINLEKDGMNVVFSIFPVRGSLAS